MGCGNIKHPNTIKEDPPNPEQNMKSDSQSNILIKYQTNKNTYKIKLYQPKP